MNVNKKFDRLRQWGKEKMGGEVKTTSSDDFKALEIEMACRHEGMPLETPRELSHTHLKLQVLRNSTTR